MARVIFDEERCKGCELCTTVCPKGIVHSVHVCALMWLLR